MADERHPQGPSRLSALTDLEPIEPFRLAESLTRCELYWLPASVPARDTERAWTLRFLAELIKRKSTEEKLRPEVFVETEAIYPDRHDLFIQTALDFNPVMGFSRTPGAPLPSVPKPEDVQPIVRQEKAFDLKPFIKGVCYWFLFKKSQKQLESFWGFGGMTLLLVKPDPAADAPVMQIPSGVKKHPAFQASFNEQETDAMLQAAASANSSFLKKTKEYFGKGWEDRLEYRGLLYVLPRWSSKEFFSLPEEEVKQLFDVCELFVTESPADQGVLVASAKPIRKLVHDAIQALREDGLEFPRRP